MTLSTFPLVTDRVGVIGDYLDMCSLGDRFEDFRVLFSVRLWKFRDTTLIKPRFLSHKSSSVHYSPIIVLLDDKKS
jgi:hypothetical protein